MNPEQIKNTYNSSISSSSFFPISPKTIKMYVNPQEQLSSPVRNEARQHQGLRCKAGESFRCRVMFSAFLRSSDGTDSMKDCVDKSYSWKSNSSLIKGITSPIQQFWISHPQIPPRDTRTGLLKPHDGRQKTHNTSILHVTIIMFPLTCTRCFGCSTFPLYVLLFPPKVKGHGKVSATETCLHIADRRYQSNPQ